MILFNKYIFPITLFLSLIGNSYYQDIPDYKREQSINDQIIEYIIDGEVVVLKSKLEDEFNLIVNQYDNTSYSILLLHGRGLYPIEPNIMDPLRNSLIDKNINIYSLQLPVLSKGKKYNDYYKIFNYSSERISSAIRYINDEKLIVIAHSCGAHMISYWLKRHEANDIDGLILIGAGAVDKYQISKNQLNYKKLNIPILNIYGELDHNSVKENAAHFQYEYLRNKYSISRNIEISGSNHNHEDSSDVLVETVKEWLKLL